jgi:hypothetical protein
MIVGQTHDALYDGAMHTTASPPAIDREHIAATERLIRPYIRRTPVIRISNIPARSNRAAPLPTC